MNADGDNSTDHHELGHKKSGFPKPPVVWEPLPSIGARKHYQPIRLFAQFAGIDCFCPGSTPRSLTSRSGFSFNPLVWRASAWSHPPEILPTNPTFRPICWYREFLTRLNLQKSYQPIRLFDQSAGKDSFWRGSTFRSLTSQSGFSFNPLVWIVSGWAQPPEILPADPAFRSIRWYREFLFRLNPRSITSRSGFSLNSLV